MISTEIYTPKSFADFCDMLKEAPPINMEQFAVSVQDGQYIVSCPIARGATDAA